MAAADDALATLASLTAIVKAQTAAWVAAGMPPTFSIDGESYDWAGWLKAMTDAIGEQTKLLVLLNPPFALTSVARG